MCTDLFLLIVDSLSRGTVYSKCTVNLRYGKTVKTVNSASQRMTRHTRPFYINFGGTTSNFYHSPSPHTPTPPVNAFISLSHVDLRNVPNGIYCSLWATNILATHLQTERWRGLSFTSDAVDAFDAISKMMQIVSALLVCWGLSAVNGFAPRSMRSSTFRRQSTLSAQLAVGDAVIAVVEDILGTVVEPRVSFMVSIFCTTKAFRHCRVR